jgi:hypothetical protein
MIRLKHILPLGLGLALVLSASGDETHAARTRDVCIASSRPAADRSTRSS